MDQMVAADRQSVAVAGHHPDRQLRPGHLEPARNRWRAAVDAVHPVGVHIIRKAARAADAAHPHHVLPPDAELRHDLLDLRQDRVIPATGAPAHLLVGNEILLRVLRLVGWCGTHSRYLSTARSGVTRAALPAGPVSS